MLTTIHRRLPAALLISLVFTAFPTLTYANHSWGGYHWARTSNPFTLKLGDNVSSTWDPILATTSSDWSQSTVLDTTIITPGGTIANPRRCRATGGRTEVCNATYGNNGWLGVAQIWISGAHITRATVKVNDTYFNSAPYNTTAWRNLVMCQEVGHTLGLDHQDETFSNPNLGTCMDYTNDPSTNQHPNQHDYGEVQIIYDHLDGTTTLSQTSLTGKMPPAMTDIDLAGPKQWGQRISGSRAEGHSLYMLDFGHGHKVFTFVTWAAEE